MKEKDYKLDMLRVMSMFLVIIIHLANYYCRAYASISHASYIGAIIFNTIARVAVPIFFMISGALLLSKPYDKNKNFNRIKKMVITTIIFTIVYALWDHYFMGVKWPNAISLIGSPSRAMLWFLYAIIALYAVLPFIKAMVDGMDEHLDKLFVILWLAFTGLAYLLKLWIHLDFEYPLPIVAGTYYLGYFVVGYLIYKYKDKINYKKYNLLNIIILLVSLGVTIGLTLYFSNLRDKYYSLYLAYRSLFMILASLETFILLYTNLPNKEYSLISFASKYSFGVYLIHGMLLNVLMENLLAYKDIISFVGIPIGFVILASISLFVVFILKKVPILKEYI